jgi:hypothetical protein
VISWTGYGWLALPIALPGLIVGGSVDGLVPPWAGTLAGGAIWVLVSGGLAAYAGRRVNSMATTAGRYWRNDHRIGELPLQFAGSGYAVIALGAIAHDYGESVSAWLGWATFLIGTVGTVWVSVWWHRRQVASGPAYPPSAPAAVPSPPRVIRVKRDRPRTAGPTPGAAGTGPAAPRAATGPEPVVLTSEQVRVAADAQRLTVSRREPAGRWNPTFDLHWPEIRHLRFDTEALDSIVALYAGTAAGVRRYVMDSRHLDAAGWHALAAAIAAHTDGRLTLDLTARGMP